MKTIYDHNHLEDNLISQIQELIENEIGDATQLQHIKETITNGKTLSDSDKKYLDSLILKYFRDKPSKQTNEKPKDKVFTESTDTTGNKTSYNSPKPSTKTTVSIIWQIIFSFIPILDLWSRYRIKKLRKYILCIYLPIFVIAIFMVVSLGISDLDDPNFFDSFEDSPEYMILSLLFSIFDILFIILSIYLVYKWSSEWNKQIESSNHF